MDMANAEAASVQRLNATAPFGVVEIYREAIPRFVHKTRLAATCCGFGCQMHSL